MTDELLNKAMEVQKNAHAPYSNFKVGAAILSESGNIYVGANVENAAYPEAQCAEASAIGAMVAAGESDIAQILIYADGEAECTPCGGCRQRISEFGSDDTKIHVAGAAAVRSTYSLGELLPHSFGPRNLK